MGAGNAWLLSSHIDSSDGHHNKTRRIREQGVYNKVYFLITSPNLSNSLFFLSFPPFAPILFPVCIRKEKEKAKNKHT